MEREDRIEALGAILDREAWRLIFANAEASPDTTLRIVIRRVWRNIRTALEMSKHIRDRNKGSDEVDQELAIAEPLILLGFDQDLAMRAAGLIRYL